MKINVTVYPFEGKKKSNLLAFASITLDDCFVVRNLKVMDGEKGTFIAMPSEAYEKNGETIWKDIAFPVTAEFREEISEAVMEAYEEAKSKASKKSKRK